MNRTKKFAYNSISTATLHLITMFSGFIIPRVMLTIYGSEINGLVSSITQFISYFNLVEAGISGAAIYALYKPLAEKQHKSINSILVAAKNFYNQAGVFFVTLTLIMAVIYPLYIASDIIGSIEVGLLVLIQGVNGALELFTMSKYRVLLTADQKTYVISIVSMVHIIINTILVVILANLSINIVLLRFIALLSIFLRSLMLSLYCKKQYPFINYDEKPNNTALNKRWDALYLQLLGVIQNGMPIVLLTIISKDLKLVSVYAIFNMVMYGINGILSIFSSSLAASFGEIIAKKDHKTLQKSYKEFEFIYYLLITIIYSVTFITIRSFINIYTKNITDINYDLPLTGFLFVLNGLLYNIKTPQGMLVISAGLYKETRCQTTTQALIAFVASSVLLPFYGINGLLIGSILSNLYRDIDLIIFIPKNVTKTSIRHTCMRILRIFMCVFISYLPFLYYKTMPKDITEWILHAMVTCLYTAIITCAFNAILDRQETINVVKRIKRLVLTK
jgi:O-antigen/teichoic acid export membrane protein